MKRHSDMRVEKLQELVWEYYREAGRSDLPWRVDHSPYAVVVSELMLQQTQVSRVVPKFNQFIQALPDFKALADSELATILTLWNGLGYNRRARYLWQLGQQIADQRGGQLPQTIEELCKLPGIGVNTAGAIMVYAYNQPVNFIETNIRTVFIYHFFEGAESVPDKELEPLIAAALDHDSPREWYWALMDYGSYLKAQGVNPSRRSAHYTKQSRFEGSKRQLRGLVIRLLTTSTLTEVELERLVNDQRLHTVLSDLIGEGMVSQRGRHYSLGS